MEYCKKIIDQFNNHFKLVSLISDILYNYERYAMNSNIIVIELKPPCKGTCDKINNYIKQPDTFLKLDDRFCVIVYSFIDPLNVLNVFENVKKYVLEESKSRYRYYIYPLNTNKDLTTAEIIKKLVEGLCYSKFNDED